MTDLLAVAAISAGVAVVVGGGGAWAARRAGWRSLTAAVTVASLSGVLATGLAGVLAAQVMFLSRHDLRVLLVATASACVIGAAAAAWVGRDLARAVASLAPPGPTGPGGDVVPAPTPAAGSRSVADVERVRTELRAAQRAAADAAAQAQALDASRRDLVAWMSHDLRSPLAALRAMAEAVTDEIVVAPADVRDYAARMLRETQRLSSMVDDLFDLAQLQTSARLAARGPVDLGALLRDTAALLAPVAAASGVALRLQLPAHADAGADGGGPVGGGGEHGAGGADERAAAGRPGADRAVVWGSAPDLLRAVRNLVDNAIRHTPAGGTVVLGLAVSPDGPAAAGPPGLALPVAQVRVSDGCGGIPAGDLPRVFDVGWRATAARTPTGAAGLGLPIAAGLVAAHDGAVRVHNAGPGCVFTIDLPLPLAGPAEPAPVGTGVPTPDAVPATAPDLLVRVD